jgi:hypothetical protein
MTAAPTKILISPPLPALVIQVIPMPVIPGAVVEVHWPRPGKPRHG